MMNQKRSVYAMMGLMGRNEVGRVEDQQREQSKNAKRLTAAGTARPPGAASWLYGDPLATKRRRLLNNAAGSSGQSHHSALANAQALAARLDPQEPLPPRRRRPKPSVLYNPRKQSRQARVVQETIDTSTVTSDDDHDDFCAGCGKPGDVLCCDVCELVYHLECLNPPLQTVPEGRWLCPRCNAKSQSSEKRLFSLRNVALRFQVFDDYRTRSVEASETEIQNLQAEHAQLLKQQQDIEHPAKQIALRLDAMRERKENALNDLNSVFDLLRRLVGPTLSDPFIEVKDESSAEVANPALGTTNSQDQQTASEAGKPE